MQDPNSFTHSSLFAGLGGFAHAFSREGFTSLWANENDTFATSTFEHNFRGCQLRQKDIREFSPAREGLPPPTILTAGFPCQPFSAAGARQGFHDQERGLLYLHIVRILKEYLDQRPAIILLENAGNLLSHNKGNTYHTIEQELRDAGYWITKPNACVLNTRLHTDIPHNRPRLFIVGVSTRIFSGNPFCFPDPITESRTFPQFINRRKRAPSRYYMDPNNRFAKIIADKIEQGSRSSIYLLRRHYAREYRKYCPSLTAIMGDGGHNVPFVSDRWGIRKLTPEECAAFQGYENGSLQFPDHLSEAQRYKQIGNTVTVPLVQRLAKECRHILFKYVSN